MTSLRKLEKLQKERREKIELEKLKLSKTLDGLNYPIANKHSRGQKYGEVVSNLAEGRYNGKSLAGLTLGAVVALSRSLTATDSLLVLSYSQMLKDKTPSLNSRFKELDLVQCIEFFVALSDKEDSHVKPVDKLSMRFFSGMHMSSIPSIAFT